LPEANKKMRSPQGRRQTKGGLTSGKSPFRGGPLEEILRRPGGELVWGRKVSQKGECEKKVIPITPGQQKGKDGGGC